MPDIPPLPHLRLRAVTLARAGRTVLDGLELDADVRRLGVVGRNGSGKSTLARVIAGLMEPDAGTVRLDGIDPARDRKAALGAVGILFQNPDHQIIFPTVVEEMAFGLAQQGRRKRAAETEARDWLARFGRAHWADVAVATLSQGQKHLVCLMAVLAMRPRLLVLDEPFAGLDLPTRMQLGRALDRHEGGVVHISHEPEDLAACDRVLWLDAGRIRAEGARAAVLPAYLAEMRRIGAGDDLDHLAH